MSPERVLPENLSGEEIRTAILDHIGRRLIKDGYLNQNLAYSHFTAKVSIHIECHDVGRVAEVDVTETVAPITSPEANENEFLDIADAELEINAQPPNDVRVETNQDVPVLTKQADGKQVVKGIRYSRKQVSSSKT